MLKLSVNKLNEFFSALSEKYKLYMPIKTEKGAEYAEWTEGAEYAAGVVNTGKSAKDFFFPQTENLMAFKTEGKKISISEIERENEDFVVFGMRGCDARALTVLDNVFLSEPVDTYYQNRREHGVIISMACNRPSETCFCKAFGIDASEPEGDIVCYMTEDELIFDVKTEKGEKLFAVLPSLTSLASAGGEQQAAAQKELIRNRFEKLPLSNLTSDKFGGDKTKEYFNSPVWSALSESCLGCGSCTFVCPTCQCYDIRDFKTNDGVIRYRCWDSCMYSNFTKMSAGQPRLSQLERFRQRFMHKLVYYPENNNGLFGCVGCGRCIAKCPIKMNIVKVMKTVGEGGKENG